MKRKLKIEENYVPTSQLENRITHLNNNKSDTNSYTKLQRI